MFSIVVFKLLPVKTRVSTAKSPSSSAGINSPPNDDNTMIAEIKSNITELKINLGKRTILPNAF